MEINSRNSSRCNSSQYNFAVSDDIKFHIWTNLNFDDEFAEPIIEFVLVSDIQNLWIDEGNCLTVSNDLDQIVAFLAYSDQTRTALVSLAAVYWLSLIHISEPTRPY